MEVAVTDSVVIVAGDTHALDGVRATQATWLVDDLADALTALESQITAVVAPPADVPTGRNATVRLDVQVELVEWD